ncbi:MAG TPA: LuxR C-terminal-related transcriptional regulator [Deinococcales bacterium]|nr:LuxR C-terminal-related transcriptional regulator [Deinococcales bacterium]
MAGGRRGINWFGAFWLVFLVNPTVEYYGRPRPLGEPAAGALVLAQGSEIAVRLGLSEGTVRNYLSEAIAKLGASNRVEAARVAREKGWL